MASREEITPSRFTLQERFSDAESGHKGMNVVGRVPAMNSLTEHAHFTCTAVAPFSPTFRDR